MVRRLAWFFLFGVLFFAPESLSATPSILSVTGLVKQPLNLTLRDLESYQSVKVQLNEVTRDGKYSGVFYYRGVPLRTLLELASIRKTNTDFSKKVDLAILVRNREGKEVALSWGEIFYRNPASVIVATAAVPVKPHHNCKACHSHDVYGSRLAQLQRKIRFPKLVINGDSFSDRSLEDISSVRVIDLRPKVMTKRQEKLCSFRFTVTGKIKKELAVEDLSAYAHKQVTVKIIGEGKGYHGIVQFAGVPFKLILDKAGVDGDLKTVFLISAPDGYRSLFSWGEVFLNPLGGRIMIADRVNKQPISNGGRFMMVVPDDLMADRYVKAVFEINVLQIK